MHVAAQLAIGIIKSVIKAWDDIRPFPIEGDPETPSNGAQAVGMVVGGIVVNTGIAALTEDPAAGETEAAPDFVVTPNGEAIRIPTGANGPTPTRAPGVQYTGGAGGKGLDSRVTGVRIMEGNVNQGPRAVYMNKMGQTVNPETGRTVPNADPTAHQYLDPWQ